MHAMRHFFRKVFGRAEAAAPLPATAVPPDQRVYAVGDVHGRLDLFEALVAAIEVDDAARDPAETTIVLLGDLVDRGPDSAGVLRAARALQRRRRVRILMGNHEEMFVRSLDDIEMLRHFMRHGGRETIASFGVRLEGLTSPSLDRLQALIREAVPLAELDFIASFEDAIVIGDYLFVHAGVNPELPLDGQRGEDLRWIREPFMSHPGELDLMVVHGHTIVERAETRRHRISIDTGAFMSGRLTALALEGTGRRFIEARQGDDGAITAGEIAVAN